MNLNKYTQKSREAIAEAQNIAAQYYHQEITGKHLLYALLTQENGLIPRLLEHSSTVSYTHLDVYKRQWLFR